MALSVSKNDHRDSPDEERQRRGLAWWGWILGCVGLLLAGVVGFYLLFQWSWLHRPAEQMLSEAIGRNLQIGRLTGSKGLRPRIVVEDFQIANPDWARASEMIGAERLEIVVSLPELLHGRLVLPEIRLTKPKLALERREDGTSNWTFGAEQAAEVAAPEERQEVPLIGLVVVDEGKLIFRDETLEIDMEADISTAIGQGGRNREELRLRGLGTMRNEKFELEVAGGSLLALRESDDPYPLAVEFVVGPSRVTVSGTLAEPVRFEGLDLAVGLSGPNLGRWTRITGVPLPMTAPYDLEGRLQRDDAVWSIGNLNGKVGRSDLQGDLRIDTGGERMFIEADLRSQTLDYRDIGPLVGVGPEPANAEPVKSPQQERAERREARRQQERQRQRPEPERVLPDARLAVEQLRQTEARVKFHGEQVKAPNVPLSAVDLGLTLRDGVLQLKPLRLGVASGYVDADIRIDAGKTPVRTDYDIRLSGFDLQRFLAEAGLADAGAGEIDGRIKLTGWGDTVRGSLGSANGEVRVVMDDGRISGLAVELVGLDLAEAALIAAQGDEPVPVRCFVADFQVKDGVMTPQTFVLDTIDATVTADGRISLQDERLDLRLLAHPKDASLVSARSPITIGGRFSNPEVGINPAPIGARVAGAIALGALLTPLASILAFIEPGLQQDSDCVALLQGGQKAP